MDSRLHRGFQEKERILAARGLLLRAQRVPGQCDAIEATLPQWRTDCHALGHLAWPVAEHGGRQVNRR